MTPPLTRLVPMDYPAAIQAIAALDNRIREFQAHVAHGAPVAFAVADAHRAVSAIRETFGVERHRPYDEDDQVSPQLAQYQAEGR